jgi:hypothetical protein
MSMLVVFLLITLMGYMRFSQHNKMTSFIFSHWGFEEIYMTIGHQLSKGKC